MYPLLVRIGLLLLHISMLLGIILMERAPLVSAWDYASVSPLAFAAAYGDVAEINRLLDAGAYVDERDWVGQTPLHMAAKFGRVEAAAALLARGADPRAVNAEYNETPLHNIAKVGNIEVFQLLLSHGANINAVANKGDFSGGMPIHFATLLSNSATAVRYLLDAGADINASNLHMETILHQAVQNENLAMIKLLLSRGANLSERDDAGNTPLHVAVNNLEPFEAVTRFLIDSGANVNARNNEGRTPLSMAVRRGRLAIARILLDAGANPNIRDIVENRTAFDNANNSAYLNNNPQYREMMIRLLQNRTNYFPKQTLFSPLHYAAAYGNTKLLNVILGTVSNPMRLINNDTVDFFGRTALHTAAHFQQLEAVRVLLDYGANVNAPYSEGVTPLHIAAKTGNTDVIQLLVNKGARVNANHFAHGTPLITAAEHANAYIPATALLLVRGANVSARNSGSEQAIHKAIINQNIKLAEELVKAGASVNAKATGQQTPMADLLLSACCYPQIPVLGWLIDRGAELNSRNNRGHTMLHTAIVGRKRKEVIEYLLYRGADPNAVDDDRCNAPIYLAVKMAVAGLGYASINAMPRNGTADVVQVLIKYGSDANAVDRCSGRTALELFETSSYAQQTSPTLANVLRNAGKIARNRLSNEAVNEAVAESSSSTESLASSA